MNCSSWISVNCEPEVLNAHPISKKELLSVNLKPRFCVLAICTNYKYCVSYIICSLDFKNISWTLFLLHMRTMNWVISWYILALQHLFHFIACVLFLSVSLFFLVFLRVLLIAEVLRQVGDTWNKAVELFLGS